MFQITVFDFSFKYRISKNLRSNFAIYRDTFTIMIHVLFIFTILGQTLTGILGKISVAIELYA